MPVHPARDHMKVGRQEMVSGAQTMASSCAMDGETHGGCGQKQTIRLTKVKPQQMWKCRSPSHKILTHDHDASCGACKRTS